MPSRGGTGGDGCRCPQATKLNNSPNATNKQPSHNANEIHASSNQLSFPVRRKAAAQEYDRCGASLVAPHPRRAVGREVSASTSVRKIRSGFCLSGSKAGDRSRWFTAWRCAGEGRNERRNVATRRI